MAGTATTGSTGTQQGGSGMNSGLASMLRGMPLGEIPEVPPEMEALLHDPAILSAAQQQMRTMLSTPAGRQEFEAMLDMHPMAQR